MTIYQGSRYEREKVARVLATDGLRHPTIFRRPPPDWRFDYTEHLVVEGDRLDLIAYREYGDSELWWAIAEVNSELDVPDPLPPGFVLRVPRAG